MGDFIETTLSLIIVALLIYVSYRIIKRIFKAIANIFVKRKMDESLLFLGLIYEYGDGVEKDLEKAMQCYKKSYELGNVNAYARYMRLKNSLNN